MKTLIALLITAAAIMPAQATQATWSQSQYWKVLADTRGVCTAGASYNHGSESIMLSLNSGGEWSMSFASTSVTPMRIGEVKSIRILFDNGQSFYMDGVAIDQDQIIVLGVYTKVMAQFSTSRTVYIENFMNYPLHGSAAAIKSMVECAVAMKAYVPASAPAAPAVSWERDI